MSLEHLQKLNTGLDYFHNFSHSMPLLWILANLMTSLKNVVENFQSDSL